MAQPPVEQTPSALTFRTFASSPVSGECRLLFPRCQPTTAPAAPPPRPFIFCPLFCHQVPYQELNHQLVMASALETETQQQMAVLEASGGGGGGSRVGVIPIVVGVGG